VNAAFDEISTDEKVESADGMCFFIDQEIGYSSYEHFKKDNQKVL